MWLSSSPQRVLSQRQQGLRPPMHLERRGFLDQSTQHKRALAFIQTELVPGLLHIIFTGRTCMNENAGDDTEVADGGVWTMVALGAVGMAGSHCVVRVQEYCGDWGGNQLAASFMLS